MVVRSRTPFGLGRNGCLPSRGSQLPQALPFIFSLCCPLNDRRRAAHSFFKIGRLFSLFLFLFSCPSLALLRHLILLLLLMSGNVHPNPGPIFPCSVCVGNVTRRGKSVQCCACSKWVHLRCTQLSLSKFRALGSSHSCTLAPPSTPNLLSPICPIYISSLSPPITVPRSWLSFCASCLLSSPDSLRVLQWNAGGLRARSTELLHFLSSHPVDLICIQKSNLNSSSSFRIPGFSALRSDRAPIPGLAFSPPIPRTLAAALSFSSGRAYSFLNFLPPLFLRFILTLII